MRTAGIDTNTSLNDLQKLEALYKLKKTAEKCNVTIDSAYVLLLIKIGKYEFRARHDYNTSLDYTTRALSINNEAKNEGSKLLTINACYNLGIYHQSLMLYPKALAYFDTAISLCERFFDINFLITFLECILFIIHKLYKK